MNRSITLINPNVGIATNNLVAAIYLSSDPNKPIQSIPLLKPFSATAIINFVSIPNDIHVFKLWESSDTTPNGILKGSWTYLDGQESSILISPMSISDDMTVSLQGAIANAYNTAKGIKVQAGVYTVTRALYVSDGVTVIGDGQDNTIFRTPFTKASKYFKYGTTDYNMALIAESYVKRDIGAIYNTATSPNSCPKLDLVNGHNRFYLGDGAIGYYDDDRDVNPNHPLYYPKPTNANDLAIWTSWDADRQKIKTTGRWVGLTGRENYALGMLKSRQNPTLMHTMDKESPDYIISRAGSPMHTGVRDVILRDFQINTNSIDRGKDDAINFKYDPTLIPASIRDTYDSSCLNISLNNLILSDCGGSGYEVYRGVKNGINNVMARRCANYGFYFSGVTSTTVVGCYANSCLQTGYYLSGMNYSSLISCAADSNSNAYQINNSNAISLVACGAEACRQIFNADDGVAAIYKGIAFLVKNSTGIIIDTPYSSTSRVNVTSQDLDLTLDDMQDPSSWNGTRHIVIDNCQGVVINEPTFKSYQRIRTTPIRDASGGKCNILGGAYDPTKSGSRIWQVQNFLVGAQIEVKSSSTSCRIESSRNELDLSKTSEVRTGNLDILDMGIVPHPDGHNTAYKTISGKDGNGGWTDASGSSIPIELFEYLYPINNKQDTTINKYWAWRNSLYLVRVNDDNTLKSNYQTRYKGFTSVIGNGVIDWKTKFSQFGDYVFDTVTDQSATTFIDGDKSLFTFGNFEFVDNVNSYKVPITSTINAFTKQYVEGTRTRYNYNGTTILDLLAQKGVNAFIGNAKYPNDSGGQTFDQIVALQLIQSRSELIGSDIIFGVVDNKGYRIFSIYGDQIDNKLIGFGDSDANMVKFLSTDLAIRGQSIQLLKTDGTATTTQIINRINTIINLLFGHGLTKAPTPA